MSESTKILQNVKIKPTWSTYTLTGTWATDNIVSGENLVLSLSKIQAWNTKVNNDLYGDTPAFEPKIAVTGLPVAKGGTGTTTLTANGVLIGNGTNAVTAAAPSGTANEFLISTIGNGGNVTPHFASAADTRAAMGIDDAIAAKLKDLQALTIEHIVTPTSGQTEVQAIESYVTTNSITPEVGDIYLVATDSTGESFVEYVYVPQGTDPETYGWEYIGKHQVNAATATDVTEGVVTLSDATNASDSAATGGKAATPKAVNDARIAVLDARSKVTASATVASSADDAYEIGTITITDSANGVDGTAQTVTLYGQNTDTTYDAEKGIVLDSTTNKFKAALVSETADTNAAGTGQLYATKLDANGKLATEVPWTDTKVTQSEKTTAGYYPLLFANTGIAPTVDPPTSTADITGATITTETAGVNKNKHVFVNIDGTTGNATLYSDVFVGLTTTPAANTNDGQLASTAFVQNAIAAALSTNVGNFFTGEKGVSVAYDATSGKVKVGHTQTYTAQTTAGIYKTTVDTYGHVSSATAAGVDDLTSLTASATNTNKVMATNASGQITYEDWSVLQLNCVAD